MRYDLNQILNLGDNGQFAVPAFNVYNMETVMGVMQAAEETGSPVIFQVYSRLFDESNAKFLAPIIMTAIDNLDTPAAFHLDHGAGEAEVIRALRYGATGIMIDASKQNLECNIAITRRIVEMAGNAGVSVEGELGHIGRAQDGTAAEYTKVEESVQYVRETRVKALAIMVGTAHGHYKQAPVLDIDRIKNIKAATGVHLVLHGGSGVPDEQIRSTIRAGIRKINFSTDLCCSFEDSVRTVDPSIIGLDLFMKEPVEAVKNYAISKIRLLGANQK